MRKESRILVAERKSSKILDQTRSVTHGYPDQQTSSTPTPDFNPRYINNSFRIRMMTARMLWMKSMKVILILVRITDSEIEGC